MNCRFIVKTTSLLALGMLTIGAYAGHSWNNFTWAKTSNSFTLMVVDSVSDNWWTELDETLTKWSASNVLDLQITKTDNSQSARQICGMVAGQIRVCNYSYGDTGWLGLASIGIDNKGHIDRGIAMLNDSYSLHWQDQALKNHVMCQEIGHLFGLGHTSENGTSQQSCMDYSNDWASQWPNAHDYDFLDVIYSSLENYNSYNTSLDGATDSGTDGTTDGGTTDGGDKVKGKSGTKGGKGSGKGGSKKSEPQLRQIPPMGIRISGNSNEEIWASSRRDGGLWIHHLRLVPELHEGDHDLEEEHTH